MELIRQEEKRHEEFNSHVEAWHKSQRIRQFIDAVHKGFTDVHGPVQEGSPFHKWVIWATQQADRVDPLVKSPPSILDEKSKYDYRW